jgi:predicted transcriptional regulator
MDLGVIGKNIRRHRVRLNLTQEKLAEVADCSWRYIQAIEQGTRVPSVQWLNRLSEKIRVSMKDFFEPR